MTAKEYLQQLRTIDMQLRIKESELRKLQQDVYFLNAIDYSKDVVQGVEYTTFADKIAKISEKEAEINSEWDNLINLRNEARGRIKLISDIRLQAVLIERYINIKSWEQIAVDMGYSWAQVHRFHRRALRAFDEVYRKHDIE